jgi:ubiquinone/menaquinone biosynthesis C-methylase UbiE
MQQNIYDNPAFFEGYNKLRDSGITYNDFIEQPALKELLPDLKDKCILDLGCGAGQFASYCIKNGASKIMGVDISQNMISLAKTKNSHPRIEYVHSPIEDLELPSNYFDLVVSSLAIHYIEDYTALIQKINKCLKVNGIFVYSTEHPIVTARKKMNGWAKDESGNKLYYPLDNYQEEGKREQHWYVDGVVKYHRTISTLVNELITNGYVLEKIVEPLPIPEGLQAMPKIISEQRKPSFLIVKSRKNNNKT